MVIFEAYNSQAVPQNVSDGHILFARPKRIWKEKAAKEGLVEPPLLWKPPRSPKHRYRHMPGNIFAVYCGANQLLSTKTVPVGAGLPDGP